MATRHASGVLPLEFERYLTEKIPSIRSVVVAGKGYTFNEDDYEAAELVAWAYISGDENFVRLVTEPDDCFAMARIPGKNVPVRIKWRESIPIQADRKDIKYLMAYWSDNVWVADVLESDLLRDEAGGVIHPTKRDLHWELAEAYQKKPREMMIKDLHRAAGKVGRFSTAYGAVAATLERKIESDTGTKPEEGTGEAILEALNREIPVAFWFMEQQELLPENPGYYRCASGRVRHFVPDKMFLAALGWRERRSLLSRLGREARNTPMQESVAATAARAAIALQRHYRDNNMDARVALCLYDSLATRSAIPLRFEVQKLHQRHMVDENTWEYHGRTLKYSIEQEINPAWSWPATGELKKNLYDRNFCVS